MKSKLKTMQPDRPQHDRPRHLCYRPAVFFRPFRAIALSFTEEKIWRSTKMLLFVFQKWGVFIN
jgi:hypothetical protein